jgi:hypothetical protein
MHGWLELGSRYACSGLTHLAGEDREPRRDACSVWGMWMECIPERPLEQMRSLGEVDMMHIRIADARDARKRRRSQNACPKMDASKMVIIGGMHTRVRSVVVCTRSWGCMRGDACTGEGSES